MSVADYTHALRKLLPSGKAWEFVWASGAYVWDSLLNALGAEPQRIEDDGYLLLHKVIPDNDNTDLDLWETIVGTPETELTDAQRLARVRGILVGRTDITRAQLQAAIRIAAGDDGVMLYNRAYEPFAVGLCNAGDSLAVGEWDYAWLLELLPSMFATSPDAFTGWSGFDALSTNNQRSPVALTLTADTAQFPVSPDKATCDLTGTASQDDVYMSVWVKATADVTIEFGITGKDGTERSDTFALVANGWNKITTRQSVSVGGSTPNAFLRSSAPAIDVYISWFVAGICDDELVDRISPMFPIHTRGVIGVQGEYATLLAQEPLEVTY